MLTTVTQMHAEDRYDLNPYTSVVEIYKSLKK